MKTSKNTVAGIPGADPTLPNAPLALDGKTYHLCYDFNAIIAYEEKSGENILVAFEPDNMTPTKMRQLLWAGLLRENPEITLEQTGALAGYVDMARISNAIVSALLGSRPDPEEPKNAEGATESD
jgi:hypothetical protein